MENDARQIIRLKRTFIGGGMLNHIDAFNHLLRQQFLDVMDLHIPLVGETHTFPKIEDNYWDSRQPWSTQMCLHVCIDNSISFHVQTH